MPLKRTKVLIFLLATGYMLVSYVMQAQVNRTGNDRYQQMQELGGNPYAEQEEEGAEGAKKTDTTKKKKIRKPLESYFFDDSTRKERYVVWNVDLGQNRITKGVIDTMLNDMQLDYPFLRKDVGNAFLGTLGGESIPLDYVRRPEYQYFSFAEPFEPYLFTPQNVNFYNVKRPFTQLSYYMQGQKKYSEDNLSIIHAQNISPSTGMNLEYKSRGARGIYAWQGTRDKSLSLAMSHTGKKYTVHGGYIFNGIDTKENGGIKNDRDITDTIFDLPENVDVQLRTARNRIRNNSFYLVQSYAAPLRKLNDSVFSIADRSTITFGHSIEYTRFNRKYIDTREGSGDYYQNWFKNAETTYDSISETKLSNKVFIQLQPWDRSAILGTVDAGIGMDNSRYQQSFAGLSEEMRQGRDSIHKSSAYMIYGALRGQFKKYLTWSADMTYHPFGERNQDLSLGADIALSAFIRKKHPITLSGSFRHTKSSPSYWDDTYYSNHYMWFNSFGKESETRIDASLDIPHVGFHLGVTQSVIDNKIYYNADKVVAQYSGNVSVSRVYLREDLALGGFRLKHRVLLQFSNNQNVIPVPMVSAYLTYLYEFNVVKNVLRIQVGFDARYNTKYYAFGFNPSVGQFYNQREKELGNYPYMSAFVNAKWKRMRILVKMDHINEDLFGPREYFTVLHYPLNKRAFKIGISWAFYD